MNYFIISITIVVVAVPEGTHTPYIHAYQHDKGHSLIASLLLFSYLFHSDDDDDDDADYEDGVCVCVCVCVCVWCVCMIGLPLAVTVSLAYSMRKMMLDQIIVRKLAACETMGNCTAICSDKTGTLTQNVMTVTIINFGGKEYRVDRKEDVEELMKTHATLMTEAVIINSKAWHSSPSSSSSSSSTKVEWKDGNQTEISLLQFLSQYHLNISLRENYPVEKSVPFDSVQKKSEIIITSKISEFHRKYIKGAAEVVLARCTHYVDDEGVVQVMTPPMMNTMNDMMKTMTTNGLRTIACSYIDYQRMLPHDDDNVIIDNDDGLHIVFISLFGIMDPLREGMYVHD